MKYLITGGTGFIGSNFIKSLSSNEDSVIILSRKKVNSSRQCKFIQNLESIDNKEKIDCIINLAGKPIDCIWTNKNKKELVGSRVSVTKSIERLVQRLKIKPEIVISASAIGFYGNHDDNAILNEDSIPQSSFTNHLCEKWEKESFSMLKYGIRLCVIRLGVVLGQDGGFIKKVSLPFKLGLGGKIGNGKQFFSWIHIEDVICGIKFLIKNKNLSGVYNFVSPDIISNENLTNVLGEVLKRPTIFRIPAFLIKIIFREMGEELLLEGNKIIPTNLLKDGYQFKYKDILSALKDIYKLP